MPHFDLSILLQIRPIFIRMMKDDIHMVDNFHLKRRATSIERREINGLDYPMENDLF